MVWYNTNLGIKLVAVEYSKVNGKVSKKVHEKVIYSIKQLTNFLRALDENLMFYNVHITPQKIYVEYWV